MVQLNGHDILFSKCKRSHARSENEKESYKIYNQPDLNAQPFAYQAEALLILLDHSSIQIKHANEFIVQSSTCTRVDSNQTRVKN